MATFFGSGALLGSVLGGLVVFLAPFWESWGNLGALGSLGAPWCRLGRHKGGRGVSGKIRLVRWTPPCSQNDANNHVKLVLKSYQNSISKGIDFLIDSDIDF